MKHFIPIFAAVAALLISCNNKPMNTIYQFQATSNKGEEVHFSTYEGKVLLIANTASKCGFTPQYDGLEALYQKYAEKGLVVIGFPCDQFGHQEPGSNEEIEAFCRLNQQVHFIGAFPFCLLPEIWSSFSKCGLGFQDDQKSQKTSQIHDRG